MGTFELNGEELFHTHGGELRIAMFGPPFVAVSVSRPQHSTADISMLAAMQSNGILTIDGKKLEVQLRWATTEGGYERVVGMIASQNVLDWLDNSAENADAGLALLYQRGMNEQTGEFFKRVVEESDAEDSFLIGENEDSVKFPPAGGCVFRASIATNRAFLNELVSVVARNDGKMLGWRVIPYRLNDSKIAYVIEQQEPIQMGREKWEIAPHSFKQIRGSRLELRVRQTRVFKSLRHVLKEIFDCVVPGPKVFGGDVDIPSCPSWVEFGHRKWFASEIRVKFTENDDGEDATIQDINVVLEKRPPRAPANGEHQDSTLFLIADVAGWNGDGDMLRVTPQKYTNWEVMGVTPEFEPGELGVCCIVPAAFGPDGMKGGLYLQPAIGDSRVVMLAQGQVPVSPGSAVPNNEEVAQGDIVIQADKAKIELKQGSIDVLVKDKFNIFKL